MLKNNFKKAFTLAELMVVLAIIGILSASAMNIFTGAIAEARDSSRVTDLKTMQTALESYYIKHKVYPQPAKQTSENVWGYLNEDAVASCGVALKADGTIDSTPASNKCGGKIFIKEKKVEEIECSYNYSVSDGTDSIGEFTLDEDTYKILESGEKVLEDIYEFDNLNDVCKDYVESAMVQCNEDSDNDGTDSFDCSMNSTAVSDLNIQQSYKNYKIAAENGNDSYIASNTVLKGKTFSSTSPARNNIIGWKGTLTENSGVDSVWKEEPQKPFSGFMQDTAVDPKYKSSKYKDFGFGFYPYSVFRDGVGESNIQSNGKTIIGGTAYQIAATLEKQDENGNYHPETLIVGNYKRPKKSNGKVKAGYPRSLFGNGTNVIVNEQKEGEKAKYVARPNGTSNRGIPYGVEEIE